MLQLDITEHAGKQRRLMRGKRGVVRPQLQRFMAALAFYNNYRNNNNNGHATIEMKR